MKQTFDPFDHESLEFSGDSLESGLGKRAARNAATRDTVARRMREARELCALSQGSAADLIGYKNSTQLSLVERGNRLPPYEILVKAAEVYGVSLDFLTGVSDSVERNDLLAGRNAVMRTSAEIIRGCAERLTDQLQQQLHRGTRSAAVAQVLTARAAKTMQALALFRKLNEQCFDDLRGGASLLHTMRELQEATAEAQATFNTQPAQQSFERRHRV